MSEFTLSQKKFLNDLFTQMTDTFNKQSRDIKEELKQQIEDLKAEVQSVISSYEEKVLYLEEKNKIFEKQVIELDRRARKNNLVFFGIKKSVNLQPTILNLIRNSLNIQISESDINEIHALGSKDRTATPILVEFLSYQKKQLILKNCHKLKDKKIFISHDESVEDRATKKILLKHRWLARKKGLQAQIKGYKLLVGKEFYTAEQLESVTNTGSPQKSDSAPATPDSQNRQRRLLEQFGLSEEYTQQENKTCKASTSNTKNTKGTPSRVLRSKITQ